MLFSFLDIFDALEVNLAQIAKTDSLNFNILFKGKGDGPVEAIDGVINLVHD